MNIKNKTAFSHILFLGVSMISVSLAADDLGEVEINKNARRESSHQVRDRILARRSNLRRPTPKPHHSKPGLAVSVAEYREKTGALREKKEREAKEAQQVLEATETIAEEILVPKKAQPAVKTLFNYFFPSK